MLNRTGSKKKKNLSGIVLTCLCASPLFLVRLNDSMLLGNHHMEHDGFSDKSEREAHDDWDAAANENGSRLTEESDVDQSDEMSPGPQATAYVEQSTEEMAEVSAAIIARVFLSWRLSLIPLLSLWPVWP